MKKEKKTTSKRKKLPRYMMATKAIHKTGNISRKNPDLCYVCSEDAENFIGNWVTGFGFVYVKFPKNTTRELTVKERDEFNGMQIKIGDRIFIIETKKNKIPTKAITVKTKNSVYHMGKTDKNGVRTISRNKNPLDFKEGVIKFLVLGKNMALYPTNPPDKVWITSKVLSIE